MVRVLDEGLPVNVELNIDVTFHPETPDRPNGFNVIGELPGTDLADEIVLIGGHFDSWHAATGATDNATGSAMMEVLRIIKAAGLRPRRTIRIALWGAEEQGLIGSRAYAEKYLGTAEKPGPEQAKHSAYFNLDNGTGKVRGIWMQSNPHVAPIFSAWIAPLKDLGVEILGPRSVTSTDHSNIDRTGVPGFQFVQERPQQMPRQRLAEAERNCQLLPVCGHLRRSEQPAPLGRDTGTEHARRCHEGRSANRGGPGAPHFRDLVDAAGNNVRITFNSVDAAHVASRHTWYRFAVTPGNADVANSMLPEAIKAVDIEAIGARLLQTPAVQTLVSGLAPASSGRAHAVDGAITYEVRVTLQSGINGMTTFYPITGAGVETLSKDAMRAIIWQRICLILRGSPISSV